MDGGGRGQARPDVIGHNPPTPRELFESLEGEGFEDIEEAEKNEGESGGKIA